MTEKKTTKKTAQEKPAVTRAEKKDATKSLILEALKEGKTKSNELIEKAAALYAQRFGGETENPNDVKGRVGSVLDVMKKEGEVLFDGGVYALKEEGAPAEKPVRVRQKKTAAKEAVKAEEQTAETPKTKRTTKKKTKSVETTEENAEKEEAKPLPAAPLQPIAPTAPITPETAPEPIPEEKPKKRGRKPKAAQAVRVEDPISAKAEEKETEKETQENKEEAKVETKEADKEKDEKALAPKNTVMDMSFLFGNVKPVQKREEPKPVLSPVFAIETENKKVEKTETMPKTESVLEKPAQAAQKPVPVPMTAPVPATVSLSAPKTAEKQKDATRKIVRENVRNVRNVKTPTRALTPDEKLQEAFLNRLRKLGGEYFEYYSVYLLERYSRKNGRRLESLKITGGDRDGGIDGEIELTDRFGFRETIYIQSKNWNPEKGDEKSWVVGETLLQQFIGACVCRQAKDGKRHCRGIFMTTSRFTSEAKKLLQDTSDHFVGYDGGDIYEAAKECSFGLIKKNNGEWALDETLLSGEKAFFNMH